MSSYKQKLEAMSAAVANAEKQTSIRNDSITPPSKAAKKTAAPVARTAAKPIARKPAPKRDPKVAVASRKRTTTSSAASQKSKRARRAIMDDDEEEEEIAEQEAEEDDVNEDEYEATDAEEDQDEGEHADDDEQPSAAARLSSANPKKTQRSSGNEKTPRKAPVDKNEAAPRVVAPVRPSELFSSFGLHCRDQPAFAGMKPSLHKFATMTGVRDPAKVELTEVVMMGSLMMMCSQVAQNAALIHSQLTDATNRKAFDLGALALMQTKCQLMGDLHKRTARVVAK